MSIPGSGLGPIWPPRRDPVGMRLRERKDWMLAGEVPKACAIQESVLPSEAHRRMLSSWPLREILRLIATPLSFPHAHGPASPILRREGPVRPQCPRKPEEDAVHVKDRQGTFTDGSVFAMAPPWPQLCRRGRARRFRAVASVVSDDPASRILPVCKRGAEVS